jgi:hypothetical protein
VSPETTDYFAHVNLVMLMTDAGVADSVDIGALDTTVRAGETVSTTVTAGEDAGELTVELVVDGTTVDTGILDPDEGTASVDLGWTVPASAVGAVEVSVETPAGASTTSVTVEDTPATFAVELDTVPEHVSAGNTATVVAGVENEGTLAGRATVRFLVDGDTEETRTRELDGQTGDTVAFEYTVSAENAPEMTFGVETPDDSAETTVPVVTGSVTPLRSPRSKNGMGVFGWLLLAGMAILIVPLLPVLAVLKLLDVLSGGNDRTG